MRHRNDFHTMLDAGEVPLHILSTADSVGEKNRGKDQDTWSRCFWLVRHQRLLRQIGRQRIRMVTEISKTYLQVATHGCRKDPITKSIYWTEHGLTWREGGRERATRLPARQNCWRVIAVGAATKPTHLCSRFPSDLMLLLVWPDQ